MINLNLKNENGRSMIEMLGVLAIIGVLSVGGIAGYSKAMTKYRINKTIEQITLIAGNIKAFFASQGNYEGLDSSTATGKAIIKKAKLVPDEMWDDDNIKSIWGKNVNLHYVEKVSTGPNWVNDYKQFRILYAMEADYELCIELMSHDWTAAGVGGIVLYGPSNYSAMTPVSVDTAVDKCSSWIKKLQDYHSTSGTMGLYFDLKGNCSFSGQTLYCP